jgi:hypothetical protein
VIVRFWRLNVAEKPVCAGTSSTVLSTGARSKLSSSQAACGTPAATPIARAAAMNGAGPQHSTVRGQIGHERAQQFRRNPPDRPEMPALIRAGRSRESADWARERLQVCREGEIGKAPRGVKEHHVGPCRRIGEGARHGDRGDPRSAESSSSFSGRGRGSVKAPEGPIARIVSPTRKASWSRFDTRPPGTRLTLTAIVRGRSAEDESE